MTYLPPPKNWLGPVLSRYTLGGDEDLIRGYIGKGTPRMPGFRYYFEPAQINAIVAYIKTVPPSLPSRAGGRGAAGGPGGRRRRASREEGSDAGSR
jgi:mono/diheme cytochrome c family protein